MRAHETGAAGTVRQKEAPLASGLNRSATNWHGRMARCAHP